MSKQTEMLKVNFYMIFEKGNIIIHKETLNILKFAENKSRFFWKCADEFEGANMKKSKTNDFNTSERIK